MRNQDRSKGKLILNIGCGEDCYGTVRVDLYRGNANLLANAEGILPFRDDSFDEVYSRFLFEHLRNPSNFLKEVSRILKPGGCVILITDNAAYLPFHVNQRYGSGFHARNGYRGASFLDKHLSLYTPEHLIYHLSIYNYHIQKISYAYSLDVTQKKAGPFQRLSKLLSISELLPFLRPFICPNIVIVAINCHEEA